MTGGGVYGTEPGSQTLLVRIYAPFGGAIGDVMVDGTRIGSAKRV